MKTITVKVSDEIYALLEVLTRGKEAPCRSVNDVVLKLIDHAQQGVYRPGAWERDWLIQAFGSDFVYELEADTRPPGCFDRPKPQQDDPPPDDYCVDPIGDADGDETTVGNFGE